MVITSLSERWGAGPGRSKACRITADPFIASSTMVKRVVRTVAFSSIRSALLVCLCVYKLKRTTVLFLCHQLAQSVSMDKAWGLRQGADRYLSKPFSQETFVHLFEQELTDPY